jgi:hypothetical protein
VNYGSIANVRASVKIVNYKLIGQDKIHFYCGRCDKAAGKILKTVSDGSNARALQK